MDGSQSFRIALVIEGEIATTHIVARVVQEAAGERASVTNVLLPVFSPASLKGTVMPILVRIGNPVGLPMVRWLIKKRIPYVYYVDDNFWELAGDTPLDRFYQSPGVRDMLELCIRSATIVIVNSQLLGQYLAQRFCVRPTVLNAPFDFSLLRNLPVPASHSGEIRIAFAGSPTRAADFDVVTGALHRILTDFDNTALYFFGYCPHTLRHLPRVHFFEHMNDYASFIAFKHACALNIGIAPMASVASNLYKTNNKYREYGALGIAGVYTRTAPYETSVHDGETGLLVSHDEQSWYDALARLVTDATLRRRIAEQAFSDVTKNYAQSVVAAKWRQVLDTAFAAQSVRSAPRVKNWEDFFVKTETRATFWRIRLWSFMVRHAISIKRCTVGRVMGARR